MLKHPLQTERRARYALDRIKDSIYLQRAPLQVSCWEVNGEPVPFAQAVKGEYRSFSAGQSWGGAWDTVWFHFQGKIPSDWKGCDVVALVRLANPKIGNEGFIAEGLIYSEGEPVSAINVNRCEVKCAKKATGREKINFYIEAASNPHFNWAKREMLMPDYGSTPIFSLEQGELACVDREAEALYYDFKVCLEAMENLPVDSQRRGELRYALNDAVNAFNSEEATAVSQARAALKTVMSKRNGDTVHTISAVGHAHIDTAWLWPLRESIRKCARTFSTALDYMERYPEYVFVCSQAVQYQWMKAYYPTIWERMKKAIKRGQWEPVGSMWTETDCNLVSGESLVRQILKGKRFFQEELGYETRDAWLPDVFGYAASMPQILAQSGIDHFLTQKISWSQFNKFPHQTFMWEGIDGSRIFTHFPPADTYNADSGPKQLINSVLNFKEQDRASRSLLIYGYGDGGGGPTIEMLETLRRTKNFNGVPQTVPEKTTAFFAKAKADAKDLPLWVGELYLELHRGTYTTQAANKRGNRKSEFLLRDAEFFDAVSLLLAARRKETAANPGRAVYDVTGLNEKGANTHRAALDRAWKLVLLNQFHDIIPGSSIHWVHEDSARDYTTVRLLGESVRDSALAALEPLIDTRGLAKPVLVFNTLGFVRREVIELPDGRIGQIDVPPFGYTVVEGNTSPLPSIAVTAAGGSGGFTLENGFVRVKIDANGQLVSVYDLVTEREALSGPANVLQMHEDIPGEADAWDVEIFYKERLRVLNGINSLKLVESTPLRAVVELARSFGKSTLKQRIVLNAGSPRIDFVTEMDWQETQKILKVAFPVNIRAMDATYEIQYGHLKRPTHMNTTWDMGRFEVCSHKWADLSEHGYGVALLNDCKYGYDIEGNVMRLTLLRSPVSPDPVADKGRHLFTYSLLPHTGDLRQGRVIEEGYALNVPLLAREVKPHGGSLPQRHSFFAVDSPGAVIEAVKVSEDGKALIVRLYESEGGRGSCRLTTALPLKKAARANLLEKALEPIAFKDGELSLQLRPFEIVTLRFEL